MPFKDRFPEFASVPDALIAELEAEALVQVGNSWIESDRVLARQLYVAHILASEGRGSRSIDNGSGGSIALSTDVGELEVGEVRMRFGSGSGSGGSGSGGAGGSPFNSTSYGQRFLALMRRSFPAVLVV